MGTALLFLILLDVIILVGAFGGARIYLAFVVTLVVLFLIAAIWIRNSRLERTLGVDEGKAF